MNGIETANVNRKQKEEKYNKQAHLEFEKASF